MQRRRVGDLPRRLGLVRTRLQEPGVGLDVSVDDRLLIGGVDVPGLALLAS